MSIALVKTNSGFNAFVGSKEFSIPNTHEKYTDLLQCIREQDEEKFLELADRQQALTKYVSGSCTVENGQVLFNGVAVHGVVVNKILEMQSEGFPFDYMLRFLEQLQLNPSARAVNELYDFLNHRNIPISDRGTFLCYKSVRSDYYSKTSGNTVLITGTVNEDGRIFNGIGETIECARNAVNDDKDQTCSYGLHAGSLEYSGPNGSFNKSGDKVLVVEINPADVVSIPSDYSAQKLRTCKYIVIREFDMPLSSTVESDYVPDEYDDEEIWDGDEVDEAMVGDKIVFEYLGETRYLDVEQVNDKYVEGFLMSPETAVGEYRRFKVKDVVDIRVLN